MRHAPSLVEGYEVVQIVICGTSQAHTNPRNRFESSDIMFSKPQELWQFDDLQGSSLMRWRIYVCDYLQGRNDSVMLRTEYYKHKCMYTLSWAVSKILCHMWKKILCHVWECLTFPACIIYKLCIYVAFSFSLFFSLSIICSFFCGNCS